MTNFSKPRGVRKSIFNTTAAFVGAAAAAAMFTPTTALAQDAAVEEDEVIVVTGTRIQRPDYQFANPVVSSTAEEISNSGTTNLLTYLETVPSLNNSLNGTEAFPLGGFAGVDLLNLRNLGPNRTLVLVDGRRHVPGNPGTGAVDVSTIPTDLVERIDVLTGGASAIYGADGVSGVVNFIMRDDFEGLRVRGDFGAPSDEGQDTEFASATFGMNFAEGRGNIAGSVELNNEARLLCTQRDFCIDEIRFVTNPNNAIYGPYSRIPLGGLVWFASGRGGALDTNGDIAFPDFDGNTDAAWDFGTDFDPPLGVYDIGFTFGQGGSGTPTAGYTETLLPSVERLNFNLFSHFDVNDSMRLFGQMKMVHSEAFNNVQPSFDYYNAISLDNPFIPPNTLADALLNGDPGLPFIFTTRDNFDMGIGGENQERDTVRGVVGIDGDLNEHTRYEVSFTAGQLSEDYTSTNARFEDRFAAALDVVDPDGAGPLGPTCRVNVNPAAYLASFNLVDRESVIGFPNFPGPLSFAPGPGSGCVPLNTFGDGSPSAAAVDWIMNDLHTQSRIRQQVFSASLNGDFGSFMSLQGGEIGWAGGVEWRRETLTSTPDNFSQIGVTQAGPVPITRGGYEVTEAFVELSLPLLRDMPFAESLTLDWAHRYSDYTSLGSTNAWKFGLAWTPIDDLTFRATRAEAVRAPNITELYSPQSTTFLFILDPCRADQLPFAPDVALRTANCATLLTAAGVAVPGAFVDPFAAFTKTGTTGGNPDLTVETAATDTFGVIYRPSFIEGFTFSADYYDIVLLDAINPTDPQDLADHCVDAPSVPNTFCDALTRQVGGASAGGIIHFLQSSLNVAEFTTRGIDFTIAYQFDPADWGLGELGTVELRAIGNNTQEIGFVPLPGSAKDDDLSEVASRAPDWQLNFDATWSLGPWTTHYGYNFSTDMLRYENNQYAADPLRVAPQYKYVDGVGSHSFQIRYNFNDRFEIYGGANNLGYDTQAGDPYVNDPNGPFYYVGAVANFN